MIERLDKVEERYKEIQEKLSTDEVIQDVKKTTELSKELRSLEDVVNAYNEYKTILNGITEAKEMENDKELGEFAKEELTRLYETNKPFNFIMETADTHRPGGYLRPAGCPGRPGRGKGRCQGRLCPYRGRRVQGPRDAGGANSFSRGRRSGRGGRHHSGG